MVHEILLVAIYSQEGQCGYMKRKGVDLMVTKEKVALLFLQLVAEFPLPVQQHVLHVQSANSLRQDFINGER